MMAVACVMSLHLVAKDYHYTTVPGDLTQTRVYKLDNGLTVYLSVNKEKPRLQANIAVKTGSRNDPAETTGLAHYLEHLMFKGTKQFGVTDPVAEATLSRRHRGPLREIPQDDRHCPAQAGLPRD